MKSFFSSILFLCLVCATVFAQNMAPSPQIITVSGSLYDLAAQPVPQMTVELGFNGQVLGSTLSAADGSYSIQVQNYGGIHTIDLRVMREDCEVVKIDDMPLREDKIQMNMNLPIKKGEEFWCKDDVKGCGYGRYVYSMLGYASEPGRMFRSPYGTFAYYKRDYFKPVVYYEKISLYTQVVDASGIPIKKPMWKLKSATTVQSVKVLPMMMEPYG